ncbi:MAG TPA: alpha/beta hydrolase [Candidatus Limnocylindria bacterium]|nr:alpha/beta hydrolase [Candidatus Limnocylindria bacterium]
MPALAALPLQAAVWVLQSLPDPVLRLLSGQLTPIRRDDLELCADVQFTLAVLRLMGHRPLDTMTVEEARAEIRSTSRLANTLVEPVARVESLTVDGAAGPLGARLYVPSGTGRRPLIVYYHGGGWVVGDLDTHESVCRFLASEVRAPVLAIDYRLAPEHKYPAAADDAVAAFRWAAREAGALGCDPARIAVAGDSAGGNLSAVVSQVTTREGGPRPAAQMLIYPATDLLDRHPSYRLFGDGFFLTAGEMEWYIGHYLPNTEAAREPKASPLRAPDVAGLPPALVLTAGFDPLRDEGEAYAKRLEEAGTRVWFRRYAGLIHGFANTTSVSRTGRAAMLEAASALRDVLGA